MLNTNYANYAKFYYAHFLLNVLPFSVFLSQSPYVTKPIVKLFIFTPKQSHVKLKPVPFFKQNSKLLAVLFFLATNKTNT